MEDDAAIRILKERRSQQYQRRENHDPNKGYRLDHLRRGSTGRLHDLGQKIKELTINYSGDPALYGKNSRRALIGLGATAVGYTVSPIIGTPFLLYTLTKFYQAHQDKKLRGLR
jgi:hypothetical protein